MSNSIYDRIGDSGKKPLSFAASYSLEFFNSVETKENQNIEFYRI